MTSLIDTWRKTCICVIVRQRKKTREYACVRVYAKCANKEQLYKHVCTRSKREFISTNWRTDQNVDDGAAIRVDDHLCRKVDNTKK